MPTVYLHIGMPKTGTSLIQNVLPQIRSELAQANIWTPERFMESHRVAVEASPNLPRIRNRHDYKRIFARGDATIFEQMKREAAAGRHLLLSSEYFSDCDPTVVRDVIRSHVPDVSFCIVVYLRRQDRFIESSYNQEVKASGRTTRLSWSPEEDARYHWEKRVGAWGDCFGDDAVKLMVFDELVGPDASLPLSASLLDLLGISIEPSRLAEYEAGDARFHNRSLSAELLEFRRLANMVSEIGEIDWFIEKARHQGVGQTKFSIGHELASQMMAHYGPSNDALARRFLGRNRLFDDLIEDSPDGRNTHLDSESTAKLVAVMAQEISILRKKLHRLSKDVLESSTDLGK